MKTKTLVILLIILGILAGAGTLINRLKAPKRTEGKLGAQILENLPVNEIVAVTIKTPNGIISLVKEKDLWVVANHFNYPGDFPKIIDLVRKLKETKIGRQFEASENTLTRLNLKEPDDPESKDEEKGVRVHLKGPKEKLFADVLLGKTRMTGGERSFPAGQYVMLGQDPKIYLINTDFSSFDRSPSGWLDKNLVNVKKDDVRKISFLNVEGKKILYAFERPQKGKDLQPIIFSPGSKIKTSALDRMSGALSSLGMENVVSPSTTPESIGMELTNLLEYHLFNGMIYRIYPGKTCSENDQCYLKLEVSYQEPPAEKKEEGKDESSNTGKEALEKTPEEYTREAMQINDRLRPWIFILSRWQHNAFITDPNQLLDKPDEDQEKKDG